MPNKDKITEVTTQQVIDAILYFGKVDKDKRVTKKYAMDAAVTLGLGERALLVHFHQRDQIMVQQYNKIIETLQSRVTRLMMKRGG